MQRTAGFKNCRPPSPKSRSLIEIEMIMAAVFTVIALLYGLYAVAFFLPPGIKDFVETSGAFGFFRAWFVRPLAEIMYPAWMNPCTTMAAFSMTAQDITILAAALSAMWWAIAIDSDH
ncbi:MAG: hypothetical protein AB1631_19910 [Acidobacteriota bacterium]